MPKIALLTSPGLAPVTASELTLLGLTLLNAQTLFLRNHDLLIGEIDAKALRGLFKLRTVEDIFMVFNEIPTPKDKKQLGGIVPKRFKEMILEAIPFLPKRKGKGQATGFAVFVKQDHDHEIYRKQVASVVSAAIEKDFARWRTKDPAEVEFWCFLTDKTLTVGMRLTRSSFRERNYRDDERVGSLRPTIAAGLVVLSDPMPGESFLDPMCGSGTILLERSCFAPTLELHGYDTDSSALEHARMSSEKAGVKLILKRTDSTRNVNAGRLFDKIVCNLPFGKSFSSEEELPKLYEAALKNWKKSLSPQGSMTLLTSEPELLERAARANGLKTSLVAKLRVKGLKTSVVQARVAE